MRKGLTVALVVVLALLLTAGVGYAVLMRDYARAGETLYYNGVVVTMDPDRPQAQAVLVRDGRIAAVGSDEELRSQAGEGAALVDLDGRALVPGFIDAHTHVDISAFLHGMVDLSGFTHESNDEVWTALRSAVAEAEPGVWIAARGLDPILTPDLETPTVAELDAIAPDNPLVIFAQTLHTYWANSLALEAAGVTRATPDPSTASYYERDDDGNLTGRIVEQEAFEPVREALLDATPNDVLLARFADTLRDYAAHGNTTVATAGLSSDQGILVRLMEHLSADRPTLVGQALAAIGMFPDREPLPRHFLYVRPEMPQFIPDSPDNGDDAFGVLGIKLWYDGSPYTGSMYLSQPYEQSPLSIDELHIHTGQTGEALMTEEDFTEAVRDFNSRGWQVLVHAQGDQALSEVADGFVAAAEGQDTAALRNRVEHGLMEDPALLEELGSVDVTTSFHIDHIHYYGEALRDSIIGPERADAVLPAGTATRLGQPFSLHADQPMFDSDPLHLMRTAVTRQTKEGDVLGADQAITVEQALRAVTIDAAWHLGLEDTIGSITPGKYADLVILDANPLDTPVADLPDITVVATIVNGNEVALG